MMRSTASAALMILGLSATALAQDYSWVETRFHRVHLRNGNFIDGNVTDLTAREVCLKLKVGEMNIRRDSIDRIELVKMRSLMEKPKLDPLLKKMEGKPIARRTPRLNRNTAEPVIPVPDVEEALKDNVNALLGRMRFAKGDQRDALMLELRWLPNAGPYLASQLGKVNDELIGWVGRALGGMKDPESLPYIVAHLDSLREVVVIEAVRLIGELEDPEWARHVRPMLGHPQAAVRAAAIFSLQQLSDRDSLPNILDMLQESDRAVRSTAIVASINMGKKFGEVEMVADQLRQALFNPSHEALLDLISAVGRLQHAPMWDAVAPHLRDSDENVRCAAADAIGSLAAKDSIDALLLQLQMESEKRVRVRLARSAAALRSTKFTETLIDWLRDADDEIVLTANKSLEAITSRRFGADYQLWSAWWDQAQSR